MKRIAVLILIIIWVPVLVCCAQSQQNKYINFLADLDITTRFAWCYGRVESEKAGLYIAGELTALKQDIESWNGDLAEAEKANDYFIGCADMLLECMAYQEDGLDEAGRETLAAAAEQLHNAKAALVVINKGGEYV